MTEPRYYWPNEVANELLISPSTLRRWSGEFSDFLSSAAGRSLGDDEDHASHRRYTDEDLETLMAIKGLLSQGLTYIQVGRRLEARRKHPTAAQQVVEAQDPQVTTLGPPLRDSSMTPAITVLAGTLQTVTEGQQLLLGSQQANRELLTVVIQDNFGLKEENTKLRDRMLVLERDVVEMRRVEDRRRESLEERLLRLEELVRPRKQPQKEKERSGCLSQLLGF
jgi:DNA-binding transcriptional MerR regulator